MYLKKVLISFIKFKNVLFLLTGLFFTLTGIADIISLTVYYWGDFDTVINARSTPESVIFFIIGTLMLICCTLSQYAIKQAAFYSGYFECSLYNTIGYEELGAVSGKRPESLSWKMHILRILYMKRFSFKKEGKEEHIELYSRKILCSCRSCGAQIDKSEYFAGICPYCKTSDVFATVVADEKVYSISSDFEKIKNTPESYLNKFIILKTVFYFITSVIFLTCSFVLLMVIINSSMNYNDQEYLKQVLLSGKSYSSYELIKKDILDTIIWTIFFDLIFLPLAVLSFRKLFLIMKAKGYSKKFALSSSPFVRMSSFDEKSAKAVRNIRRAIEARYLRNCSIEMHNGKLRVSLAKKIVKDKCPYCGAPIVGAVNDSYTCKFCHKKILQVIDKSGIS